MRAIIHCVILGMCIFVGAGCQGGVWAGSWHKSAGIFVGKNNASDAARERVEADFTAGRIDQYERDIRLNQIARDFDQE